MASTFTGFSPRALSFFRQLEKNNDRDWFAARKELFEVEVRGPMVELVRLLSDDFRAFAADYIPDKPEKAIYRIYRDTRFSHDKTPYKTHIGANFQHRRIPKNRGAGFYFEVSHKGLGIAGGIYMPEPEQILAVRKYLGEQWKQFQSVTSDRSLKKLFGDLQGDSLARVPKGFDPKSPAADAIRRKQLYFYREMDKKFATGPGIRKLVLDHFHRLAPFIEFLNDAILRDIGDETDLRPKRPEPMF